VCHVGIAGRLTLEKAGCEVLVRPIDKHALTDEHLVQDLLLAGLTAQAQHPMGQEATLEGVVTFALYIGGPACGSGIVVERDEKRLQVFRDHVGENRAAWIPGVVGGNRWRHESTHVQYRGEREERKCHR
jgi:hypothetical protein